MTTTKTLQDKAINFDKIQLLICKVTGEIIMTSGYTTPRQDTSDKFTGTYVTGVQTGVTIEDLERKDFDKYHGTVTLKND